MNSVQIYRSTTCSSWPKLWWD